MIPITLPFNQRKGRIILKYSKERIENSKKSGILYVPPQLENAGEWQCENAEVIGVSKEIEDIKKGDTVVVGYGIIYDSPFRVKSKEEPVIEKNKHYIEIDKDGNEYRWCYADDVYAVIKEDKVLPVKGWAFCDKIVDKPKPKSKIILLNPDEFTNEKTLQERKDYMQQLQNQIKDKARQNFFGAKFDLTHDTELFTAALESYNYMKIKEENRALKMKVNYVNSLEEGVKKLINKIIYISPKFDFRFKVGSKYIFACPLHQVLAYEA